MTKNESTERLTIEEVLLHPAFYNSQEKLDFVLTFHANVNTVTKSWENRKNSLKKLRKEGTEEKIIEKIEQEINKLWQIIDHVNKKLNICNRSLEDDNATPKKMQT